MLHNTVTDSHIGQTIAGTVGGTLLAVTTIHTENIVNTIILAGIGAATSFLVTIGVKHIWYKYISPEKKNKQ